MCSRVGSGREMSPCDFSHSKSSELLQTFYRIFKSERIQKFYRVCTELPSKKLQEIYRVSSNCTFFGPSNLSGFSQTNHRNVSEFLQRMYRKVTEIWQQHIYRDSSRKVSKVLQDIYRDNTEFKNLQEFYRDSTDNIFRWVIT